jgi:sec-independent protein translocase protein TatA
MRFGPLEIGLILVLVLIVFGVGKLPQIGGAVGKSIREFRRERDGSSKEQPQVDMHASTSQPETKA